MASPVLRKLAVVMGVSSLACGGSNADPTPAPVATSAPAQLRAKDTRTAASIDEQYELVKTTLARARSSAHDAPTDDRQGTESAETSVQGREDLHGCNGRHSGATASASASIGIESQYAARGRLSLSTRANGGHYLGGPCWLNQGHDTEASSEAEARVDFEIHFDPRVRPARYDVGVTIEPGGAQRGQMTVETSATRLDKGDAVTRNDDGAFVIDAAPGARFAFRVAARLGSRDRGACCEDPKSATADVNVTLRRAPLLERILADRRMPSIEGEFRPYIIGGRLTKDFEPVGALLIGERLHCTATLVGRTTAVTAAHCLVRSFADDVTKGRMKLRLGPNAFDDQQPSARVSETSIPETYREPESGPFEDDIALVYLAEAPSVNGHYAAHEAPELSRAQSLEFVGFGYDRVGGTLIEAGVKRQASMGVRQLEPRRFYYGEAGTQTCSGDSGGPALLVDRSVTPPRLLIAGVTSGGDVNCRGGAVDTRVEAFRQWLSGRIRN